MWVGLSGGIGAGKTAVGRCLAEALSLPMASFGDYVRSEAALRRRAMDRASLQDLGEELISELGWTEFCRCVLEHGGIRAGAEGAVVEGIRHVSALATLNEIVAPDRLRLVHLDVPQAVRESRLRASGVDGEKLRSLETHATEADVAQRLRVAADVLVQGSDSIELCRQARTALDGL